MIDLHTHTLFSDGELLPSELVRRAEAKGYEAIALTDHVDRSNLEWVIPRLVQVCGELNDYWKIQAIPGIELTHIPPALIAPLSQRARELGAQLVLVHGETIVEPVAPGTNREAIEAGVDILAHPGLITEEDVSFAQKKGVLLEISTRKGHSLANGHVALWAKRVGARLVVNNDAHSPEDLTSEEEALKVVLGAGLRTEDFEKMLKTSAELAFQRKRR
jgi:putative hydrolase